MLLSILGNIFGQEDGDGQANAGDDGLGDGQLSGSMSDDGLMPGSQSGGGTESDDDLFGDGVDDDPFGGGDLDDGGGMSLDGMDDDGGVSSELESRVEEMENDVGSLASTVNTVQSENEKISESIEEIEENIRKLLEVYEMVTQGVNPFVEGDTLSDTFEGGAQGTGNFGGQSLFDTGDDEEEDETVDEDIANAEAEEFLDESLLDDDGFEDESFNDELAADSDSGGGGDEDLSFDELKSEYESGEAEWDEDAGAADDFDDPFEDEGTLDDGTTELDDGAALEEGTAGLEGSTGGLDGGTAGLDDGADFDDIDRDPIGDTLEEDPAEAETLWADDDRPYLAAIPSEYETELLVMDWVEFLIEEVGLNGAARTIRFYRSVDWVSPSVETYLQTMLNGFNGGPDLADPDPCSSLGVDHKRSLWWIGQIATPEKKRLSFDEWLEEQTISILQGDDTDERSDEWVTFTESSLDDEPPGRDSTSEHSIDASEDRWADREPSEAVGAGAHDDELDERNAQKILIDESDEAEFDGAGRHERHAMAEQGIDTDGGRMIWVDSDVVLPESGVELRIRQSDYDGGDSVEYLHAVFEPETADESVDLEQWQEEYIKPLVVPDGDTDLERWQVELIKSLFAPEEETHSR